MSDISNDTVIVNFTGHMVRIRNEDGDLLLDSKPRGHIAVEYGERVIEGLGLGETPNQQVHVIQRTPERFTVHPAPDQPLPDFGAIVIVTPNQWADIVRCPMAVWFCEDGSKREIENPSAFWVIVAPERMSPHEMGTWACFRGEG